MIRTWTDYDDETKEHYLWECPTDEHVNCTTCGALVCEECGYVPDKGEQS